MRMEWLTVHASQTQLQPWIQASVFDKRSNSWSVFYLSRVFIFVTTQVETRRLAIKSSQVHRLDVPIAFPNYRHEPIIKSIVSLSHVRSQRPNLPPVHSECWRVDAPRSRSSKVLQVVPPDGTDITLCSTECFSSCDYFIAVPDYDVCKSVNSQAIRAEVLDNKTCAVYT